MFFDTIQQLCEKKKISVSKLAADLNLSNSISSKWKKGALPDTATLLKIADYFDVTIDYLVCDHNAAFYHRMASAKFETSIPVNSLCKIYDVSASDLENICGFDIKSVTGHSAEEWCSGPDSVLYPSGEFLDILSEFFEIEKNDLAAGRNIPFIARPSVLKKLHTGRFDLLQIDLSLFGTDGDEMAKKYRVLDEHGKKIVSFAIEEEYRRVLSVPAESPKTDKVVPLFGTSAAAGPGEPDTGLPWENYDVPEDSRAEFAVRITGDSMTPVLADGEIALCVKRRPQVGDLAVIMVNGALLVKQYIRDNYGNVYLRSLNRARRDCDYDIKASGNDTVMCYGIVMLKKRPALVEE